MSEQPVDVLIIGAGASGAAFAWSLADTRMNILCLEQGDWMRSGRLPEHARRLGGCASSATSRFSPNVRGRARGLPGQRRGLADRGRRCSTPSAAARSSTRRTSRASTRRTSACARSTASPTTGRSTTRTLEPYYDVERPHDGRLRAWPAIPPIRRRRCRCRRCRSASSARRWRAASTALGWHWWPSDSAITTARVRGPRACINAGTCLTGCAQGAKASTDITYWPVALRRGVRARRRAAACARSRVGANGMADGVDLLRRRRRRAPAAARTSSSSPATASARRACCSTRARRSSPTASRTAAAWSART